MHSFLIYRYMKNKLFVLACFSIFTFFLSLSTPITRQIVHAQTTIQDSVPGENFPLQADGEAIDAFVEELMADRQIPGLSLAVVYDQKIIKITSYGMIDRELNVKARPSSIFPIASMSKPITAMAVMMLVEEGKLDLDEPISTYFPEAPEIWNTMTLRHALTHTAGLPEDIGRSAPQVSLALDEFVEAAAENPLNFQPGESWVYSNTGYELAAAVVEKVSEEPFAEFVSSRIFEPLNMHNTDVLRDSYRFSNRARGYDRFNNQIESISWNSNQLQEAMWLYQGSASVTSNVVDLSQWAVALQKDQLLSEASYAEMEQLNVMNSGLVSQYGLGWFLTERNGRRRVTHGGSLRGYSTGITRFPDDKLTVIVLANKYHEDGDRLALRIAEQYIPALMPHVDLPVINDTNPALTAQLLAYLQGDTAAITSTPERQIALDRTSRGASLNRAWDRYRREHSPEKLELIAQAPHPNGTKYRYRVIEANDEHFLIATVTPNGLIAELGIGVDLDD